MSTVLDTAAAQFSQKSVARARFVSPIGLGAEECALAHDRQTINAGRLQGAARVAGEGPDFASRDEKLEWPLASARAPAAQRCSRAGSGVAVTDGGDPATVGLLAGSVAA
jgi:hypothetical protein